MIEPKTPVLVGVAQVEQRTKDFVNAKEPVDLMLEAINNACDDTGNPSILQRVKAIRVSRGVWPYENPAKYLAEKLNLNGVETGLTVFGGNGVQTTVNRSCLDIQSGKFDAVAIAGAECGYTQAQARKAGKTVDWREIPGKPQWTIESGIGFRHELETERSIGGASQMYAVFENALRYERGESIEAHQIHVSNLWSRFNEVAQKNPGAWIRDDISAEKIREYSPRNRPIAFPYPKLMNANNNVDQGAALILLSVELATQLGIPQSKWIYPWSGTDAHDTYAVSHRAKLTSAPGLRKAAERAMAMAEVEKSDIAHFDLYSCFPSAVQVAAKELGLDLQRPLTVTGGLTFGGGPLNNYVMHAIARMAEVLRADPDELGMVTANGGYLTKHAHGVYAAKPSERPFRHEDVQDQVDTSNDRETVANPNEPVTVEGYTVTYGRESPVRGFAACLAADGKRTWGFTTDQELMREMQEREFCGRDVRIRDDGEMRLA